MTLPSSNNIFIGENFADVLNGLSFIYENRAAFLLRVGWLDGEGEYQNTALWKNADRIDFGPGAPDESYGEMGWRVGTCQIQHRWRRIGDAVAAEVTVSEPITVSLECSRSWKSFVTHYTMADAGFEGAGRRSGFMDEPAVSWTMRYDQTPESKSCHSFTTDVGLLAKRKLTRDASPGREGAAVFTLTPETPLCYVAGFGELPELASASTLIDQAAAAYEATRCRASGEWGDFIEPMMNVMNHTKAYNFETGHVCHTITRSWCREDGHNLFVWDSLFNAVMAAVEDPLGAQETVRCLFLQQEATGLVPSYSGPGWGNSWDRSQPPVGGMCVTKMHERWPDEAFLAEIYPKLLLWHDWWFAPRSDNGLPHRDGNQNGLLEWGTERDGEMQQARWESGLDDSPMYDLAIRNRETRTMELDDVGLSALWAVDSTYLAGLAEILGKTDDATRLRQEAEEMKPRLETLWNESLGTYCNRYWNDTSRVDHTMGEIIPPACLSTPDGMSGLRREVFHDVEMTQKRDETIDATIDFYAGIKTDDKRNPTYGVRWTGLLIPEEAGPKTFTIHHLNGARLWLDDVLLIDAWSPDTGEGVDRAMSCSEPIELAAGKPYALRVEYGQFSWHQRIQVGWHGPTPPAVNRVSDVISPTCFYPMMLQSPTPAQGERMLETLRERFWGEYVCPSIDRTHPSSYSEHYWRGKIWAPMNYLLYQGLRHYAEGDERKMFVKKGVDLFMRNWANHGWCNENFWTHGEGGSMPHYTWGAMLCLIGLEAACEGDTDANVQIKNLPVAGEIKDLT